MGTEQAEDRGLQVFRDRARVIQVLTDAGPCAFDDLTGHADLSDWPALRLERALVLAWADGLVTIDRDDSFVAL